ncbi:MAG TPA: mersacidin/lichenicidin family type 2 lantibiotic [Ktedonobacterales bacterium]|jgi:mersacidin/lichenicidin family type 2 lantibiotic
MSNVDIVRAWKDAEYRQGLSAEEQTLLPEHPAGAIELPDEDLAQVAGAVSGEDCFTFPNHCLTFVRICPVIPG